MYLLRGDGLSGADILRGRCAEECLNSDTCRSFATHLTTNGICCLSDFNKDTVDLPYTFEQSEGLECVLLPTRRANSANRFAAATPLPSPPHLVSWHLPL